MTPKQFREDLAALGDIKELRIFINSGGGDVFASQAIYSILRRAAPKVVVYVDGLAASGASLVAMAGDVIRMPINSMMMIHNPWTFLAGDAPYLRKVADDLDKAREGMIAVYAEQTGMKAEEIIPLLDAETWMTAQEAVDMGFADEIEDTKRIAVSLAGTRLVVNGREFDVSRYRNVPKLLTPAVADQHNADEGGEEDQALQLKRRAIELELELTNRSVKSE